MQGLKLLRLILVIVGLLILLGGVASIVARGMRGPGKRARHDGVSARPSLQESKETREADSEKPSAAVASVSNTKAAETWSRFRGPNGAGVSADPAIPTQWSETQNLKWKARLHGPGASSPVLTKDYVVVTAYSGYGDPASKAGSMDQLKRHVQCYDRKDGTLIWTQSLDAVQPEDKYSGMGIPEHGYATNSPTTDGESIFVFLGKTGVLAFDLKGNQLWRTCVGTESGNRGWGSAASLMLYDNLVIVNASEESQSLYALDKKTGNVVWSSPASTLELAYGTPAIAHIDETRDDLVLAVPGEVWGLNPKTGKLIWYVETTLTDNLTPSVIVDGLNIYVFGGYRSSGSIAVLAGGTGNVTDSNILWTSRNSSYVTTPVLHKDQLFWIDDRGLFYCIEAKTGNLFKKSRTPGIDKGQRPVYASPILINNKIYAQSRLSGMFVLEPTSEINILSQNQFASDKSVFNAAPAVDGGQLFIRSDQFLYCIESQQAP